MIWPLALAFACVALVYATSGFGGGSTYIALLAAAEVDYRLLPVIALVCNIIVVTGGAIRYAAARLIPRRAWLLVAASLPMAFLGGRMPVKEDWFLVTLGATLLVAGVLMIVSPGGKQKIAQRDELSAAAFVPGAAIGFLSGMVGIGGGVFLAPLLHLIGWDAPRRIAATAAIFILGNSCAGLAGQMMKPGAPAPGELLAWWPLAAAVLLGGAAGSKIGVSVLSERRLRQVAGALILVAAARLLFGVLQRNIFLP